MRMTLRHPLFGELFHYSGVFVLPGERLEISAAE